MAENTDIRLTAEAFAKIVIERWEQKVMAMKINRTGKLINSFHQFVQTQASGNVDFILFTFEFYGKFVDMGVGRGIKTEEVQFSLRKPRRWYSKVFYSQVIKLKDILKEKYEMKTIGGIMESIEK
jgi:hypothetical protein